MREGSPTVKTVLELLKPFIYSSSDFVKRTVACKIKSLCAFNYVQQIQQKRKEKATNAEGKLNLITKFVDVEMQEEQDSEDELNKAIQMSMQGAG